MPAGPRMHNGRSTALVALLLALPWALVQAGRPLGVQRRACAAGGTIRGASARIAAGAVQRSVRRRADGGPIQGRQDLRRCDPGRTRRRGSWPNITPRIRIRRRRSRPSSKRISRCLPWRQRPLRRPSACRSPLTSIGSGTSSRAARVRRHPTHRCCRCRNPTWCRADAFARSTTGIRTSRCWG